LANGENITSAAGDCLIFFSRIDFCEEDLCYKKYLARDDFYHRDFFRQKQWRNFVHAFGQVILISPISAVLRGLLVKSLFFKIW
jgi:hypothetical protein